MFSTKIISRAMMQSRRIPKNSFSTTKLRENQTALILGSNGALGSAIASHLKQCNGNDLTIIGADVTPMREQKGVDAFISLRGGNAEVISEDLIKGFQNLFDSKPEFDALICANGGFAMDDSDEAENLMAMNFEPCAAACSAAILDYISEDEALFVAFSATLALKEIDDDSPMKKYIESKRDVHELVQRLGSATGKALRKSKRMEDIDLRKRYPCLNKLTAIGILPSTLDTESNREAMKPSDEELERWTKLEQIAREIGTWMELKDLRPSSGNLVKCVTKDGMTDFIIAR
jgi:NAD(P)-dependent dehydrogenase (short-subunit alcohol dehydrogenase family)